MPHLTGAILPEMWNRLGTKLIPKLRSGSELKAKGGFSGLMHGKVTAVLNPSYVKFLKISAWLTKCGSKKF